MKKEFMASILTLTAGMASTISFPEYALARSNGKIEDHFAKKFNLMTNAPARYTDNTGRLIQGRIFMKLDQTPFTPAGQNQLNGEMSGYLFFQSDDNTEVSTHGEKYKTFVSLVGDDGEALLDLIDKTPENGRKYQVYGCNSTKTYCNHSDFNVIFGGSEDNEQVSLEFSLPEDYQIEILTPQTSWNQEAGKMETHMEWVRQGSIGMVLSNIKN